MVYCALLTVNSKISVLFALKLKACDPLRKYINVWTVNCYRKMSNRRNINLMPTPANYGAVAG